MHTQTQTRRSKLAGTGALVALALLVAPIAASAQGMTATKEYEVTITNLTSKQVLSPPILASHPASVHVWQMGQPASDGVKLVAEEGDNSLLASTLSGVATDVRQGTGPLMPGNSVTLTIKAHEGDVLSAAAMLVQTNDGFTGLDNQALSGSQALDAQAYDAGTEENTEKASDVPGPPFGGHMAGTPTTPRQPIAPHPGIMAKADVGANFNWSGPVARFTIKAVAGAGSDTMMGSGQGAANSGMSGGESQNSAAGSMPSMPKTGAQGQAQQGGDSMQPSGSGQKSDSMMGSNLPATGAGDRENSALPLLMVPALLVLAGLFARRASANRL